MFVLLERSIVEIPFFSRSKVVSSGKSACAEYSSSLVYLLTRVYASWNWALSSHSMSILLWWYLGNLDVRSFTKMSSKTTSLNDKLLLPTNPSNFHMISSSYFSYFFFRSFTAAVKSEESSTWYFLLWLLIHLNQTPSVFEGILY